jgi:hypothetical protein
MSVTSIHLLGAILITAGVSLFVLGIAYSYRMRSDVLNILPAVPMESASDLDFRYSDPCLPLSGQSGTQEVFFLDHRCLHLRRGRNSSLADSVASLRGEIGLNPHVR